MLNKTNILALVGGGKYPKFSKNKITIFDSHQDLIISQIRFNSNITRVKLRRDSIIGFIDNKIYILNINSLETIDIIKIDKTKSPIYSISYFSNKLVISFPQYNNIGKLQIEKYFITSKNSKKEDTIIKTAHESKIIFISNSSDGTLIATGSEKGQYIRIFNAENGDLLADLKKGKKPITWISFEKNNHFIGYSSNLGKAYIYDIKEINKLFNNNEEDKKEENNNKKEMQNKNRIYKIKAKPFVRFKFEKNECIIGFIEQNKFVIFTLEGKLYKISFDEKFKFCNLIDEFCISIRKK